MQAAAVRVLEKEWVPLKQAMALLGKSQKTIERLVNAEQLRSKLEPREGRKPERLYHAGDLDRIKQEAIPAPASEPRRALLPARATTEIAISSDTVTKLDDVMTRWLNRPAPPISIREKLWLTLDEAAELSGLPRSAVADFAAEGRITAMKRGAWFIHRASLEAFAG